MKTLRELSSYAYFIFTLFMVLSLNSHFVIADEGEYAVKLLPLAVEPVTDTAKTRISGTFKLFKDGSRSRDLEASGFSVYEDGSIDRTGDCSVRSPDDSSERMADFIFAVDVTGSMGGTIGGVKTNVNAFATNLASSGIDYRLAMVTFRDDVIIDHPTMNPSKGAWTSDANVFKDWVNRVSLGWGGDGPEASFDAVGRASDFSTREGAQRVIVLFTDINSHVKGDPSGSTDPRGVSFIYDQTSLIAKLKASGFVVYVVGPNHTQFNGVGSITTETGGEWYNTGSPIASILERIRDEVSNQYAFNCTPETPAGKHFLEIGVTKLGYEGYRSNKQEFIVKAAPIVNLSEKTSALVKDGFHVEREAIDIEVMVSDVAPPYTKEVTLYYRHSATGSAEDAGYTPVIMTAVGDGSIYRATIPSDVVLRPGIDIYVMATDGDRNGFSPKADAASKPWQISIVNHPPEVSACTPDLYDVEKPVTISTTISDADGDVVTAKLYYKVKDGLADYVSLPMTGSGTYSATIPVDATTAYGIDGYVMATDTMDGETKQACSFSPIAIPVLITSMTRQEDTSSIAGPYPVRVIALSADDVVLHYTVNGGEEVTLAMPIAVSAPSERIDRSNIYYADIPGQSAASTVEYWATASNRTSFTEDRYPKDRNYTFVVRPVPEAMAVTPETKVLTPKETISLLATGCYGKPYNWTSTAGMLSTTTGEQATLTAADVPGLYTVRAEDMSGICAATAKIQIVESVSITPSSTNLSSVGTGSKMTFLPQGGEPPYAWDISAGPATMVVSSTGDSVEVVAAATEETGNVTLTVTDSKKRAAKAKIAINGPFKLEPAGTITLPLSGKQPFKAIGGVPPYVWTVIGGNLDSNEGEVVNYDVPSVSGAYTVMVTDGAGSTNSALIVAGTPVLITPLRATAGLGETVDFDVTGGVAPYTWVATEGNISPLKSAHITFTPPKKVGFYQLMVTDASGTMLDVTVEVINDNLVITPSSATVAINGTTSFTPTGGIAPYTWTAMLGTITADGVYTAPANVGTDTVTVTDNMGKTANSTVEIAGCDTPLLNLSTAKIALNSTQQFTVSCGVAPYIWTTTMGTISPDGLYTAPSDAGSYVVTVTDSMGKTASSTVNVVGCDTPVISPSTTKVLLNGNAQFKASCAVEPLTWVATLGTILPDGNYTAPSSAGLDTITLTDGLGKVATASAEIVTSGELKVMPSITAVNANGQTTLKAIGGDGQYNWSVSSGSLSSSKGDEVSYTAPAFAGEDTVTVTDMSGATVKAIIRVIPESNELKITPTHINLSAGQSQKFTVHNAIGAVNWTTGSGEITEQGQYTAPASSGTYQVVATDYTSGRSVEATVTVSAFLTLTPTEKTLHAEESTDFTVSGGEPPYTWRVAGEGSLDNDTGDTVRFTASKTSGKVTLVVADNKALSSEATIMITGAFEISPANVTLPRGGEQHFDTVGGNGTTTWIVERGNVDTNGNYTAPEVLGTYVVTAQDTAGNKATANVTISDLPVISPANAWLDQNEETQLSVIGGIAPYRWEASAGSIIGNGNEVTYKAPKLSTDVTVTLYDSLGNKSEATIYVDLPLLASRQELFLRPGEIARIIVVGGIPGFDWQTGKGEMKTVRTEEMGENAYLAPNVYGDDVITIRDRKNSKTTVAVHVVPPLLVTPHQRYMKREKTKSFTVVSGIPPYTAVVLGEGNINPVKSDDGVFQFTSENVADKDFIVEFRDNISGKNEERVAQVHVFVERQLRTSPAEILFVPFGGKKGFNAIGGTGDFFVVADCGQAVIDSDTGVGEYIAPDVACDGDLTIVDASDQEAKIRIKVGYSEPFVSPSITTMIPGESRIFMVNHGASAYDWEFEGGTWQGKNTENSLVEITAPMVAGTYTLSVLDGKANRASSAITVAQPLLVSPVSFPVYKGESVAVRFDKLGGTGACDWSLSDLQEVERGADYIVVRPRTDVDLGSKYLVSCRDQMGDIAKSEIVVGNLPMDLDANGTISEEEMLIAIDKFFKREQLNSVTVDKRQLFLLLELFLSLTN